MQWICSGLCLLGGCRLARLPTTRCSLAFSALAVEPKAPVESVLLLPGYEQRSGHMWILCKLGYEFSRLGGKSCCGGSS